MMLDRQNPPILFIVNPSAGHGKCGKRWNKLAPKIEEKYSCEVFYTKRPGEAEAEARMAVERGIKRIFVVGGDGTINEVINGAMSANIEIGIIPFGTGNDLAKAVGLSKKKHLIEAMVLNQETLKVKEINVGKINHRHFVIACGIGFDGWVAKRANDSRFLKSLGALGYVFSVFAVLRSFTPMTIEVTIDGTSHKIENGWLLAVGNGPYYGGGMKICPDADIHDDWLDLCIVSKLSKWQLFRFFPKVYSGKHVHLKDYVTFMKGKRMKIQCQGKTVAHADGEFIDSSDLNIVLCEQGIKMLTMP